MILFDLDQTNIGLSICVRFWGSKLCSSCQSSLRTVGEQNIEQSRGNLTSWELRTLSEQLNCKFLIFSKHKVLAVYCIHDLVIQNQLCLEYLTPNREKVWLTAINHKITWKFTFSLHFNLMWMLSSAFDKATLGLHLPT